MEFNRARSHMTLNSASRLYFVCVSFASVPYVPIQQPFATTTIRQFTDRIDGRFRFHRERKRFVCFACKNPTKAIIYKKSTLNHAKRPNYNYIQLLLIPISHFGPSKVILCLFLLIISINLKKIVSLIFTIN